MDVCRAKMDVCGFNRNVYTSQRKQKRTFVELKLMCVGSKRTFIELKWMFTESTRMLTELK